MIDPMLATGGSAVAALDMLREAGAQRRPDDLHRLGAGRDRARGAASSRRPHLHAGHRPAAERPQVHRPWPRRLWRPTLWHPLSRSRTRAVERRAQFRAERDEKWRTALTCIEPNKILVRGYPLDEMMGRLTFGESIYLLLMGEVPSPSIGSLMEAVLVSFIDHGATPPSTLAARNTPRPARRCAPASPSGILGFGKLSRRRHRVLHALPRLRARAGA